MIEYTVQKNNRSWRLKISIKSSGAVVVSCPPLTPSFMIAQFVQSHADWILKNLAEIKHREPLAETPTDVYIFGKKYQLDLQTNQRRHDIVLLDNRLRIQIIKTRITTQEQKKLLAEFLKRMATEYILPRTDQLAKKMQTDINRITLREQKTRWGSCSSRGNLNFNWRLVHAPPAVIDYVIVHELAHRTHMNHSAAFWNLVKTYDPSFPQHRGWLKRHGMALD